MFTLTSQLLANSILPIKIRNKLPMICSKTICSLLEVSKYFIPVKNRKESQMIYSVLANGTYRINFDVPSVVSSNWYIVYMWSGSIYVL